MEQVEPGSQADTGGQDTAAEAAEVDSQIAEIRKNPAYIGTEFVHGTIEQKALDVKIKGLYSRKNQLAGNVADVVKAVDGNTSVKETPFDPNKRGDDLQTRGQAVLDELEGLGVDVSEESAEGMTDERLEGLRQISLIKQGDFKTVAPMLSRAAIKAGLPADDVAMIRKILPQFRDKDAAPIVEAIANYIYNKRTGD